MVFTVGDVNSTMAAALVAAKLPDVTLAHVEAGGRSFDRSMPEEINRIVTDSISDYLFAIEPAHAKNLMDEGIPKKKCFLVGDTIIDNLIYTLGKIKKHKPKQYILTTIHRPQNTDDLYRLKSILKSLNELSKTTRIKFSIHPRTRNIIEKNNLKISDCIEVLEPLGYFDFVRAMTGASVILTDSGGITIEAAVLKIPCVVVRDTLERMFLVEEGTTVLCDGTEIVAKVNSAIEKGRVKLSSVWKYLLDGNASERILQYLERYYVHTPNIFSWVRQHR